MVRIPRWVTRVREAVNAVRAAAGIGLAVSAALAGGGVDTRLVCTCLD